MMEIDSEADSEQTTFRSCVYSVTCGIVSLRFVLMQYVL